MKRKAARRMASARDTAGGGIRAVVSDPPFSARGDGKTNDRAAIQRAIDLAASEGGGSVILPSGGTYLSGGVILRTGVTLVIEEGAELLQSPDPGDYVKPDGDGYIPYRPEYGHNWSETVKWSHLWYKNYPFVFAPRGSSRFAVKGGGTIRMMEVTDESRIIKICPVGFCRCSDFEISGVRITNYHSYAVMPFTSERGLIKDVVIDGSNHGNGDGVCLMNCRHIRVTGCRMTTGDDSVYIFSSYRDPRRSEWWDSDDPQPSEDIEVDHCDLRSDHCKAFGMILWGTGCGDQEKVEVRDVYVHDNRIETLGNWLYNPYTDKAAYPPVTHVVFENNSIGGIESNFFETRVSDLRGFPSTRYLMNGGFESGRCFWILNGGAVIRRGDRGEGGRAVMPDGSELYQGVYIESGRRHLLTAAVKGGARMFVRDAVTGDVAAELETGGEDAPELRFTVPESGNYHVGFASRGEAEVSDVRFSGGAAPAGDPDVIFDRGKIIYKYSDDLFRR
ncbi:MAG: hypothetical protein K6D94_01990 [Clostridiales bacterium]|nr:hypothetical protein [Clostridiales bacterium]